MFKCLLKFGISLLTLDSDTKKSSEASEEVGVGFVELAGIRAVDFQNAEERLAFSTPFNQHVDGGPDAVIREKLRCPKSRFFLHT